MQILQQIKRGKLMMKPSKGIFSVFLLETVFNIYAWSIAVEYCRLACVTDAMVSYIIVCMSQSTLDIVLLTCNICKRRWITLFHVTSKAKAHLRLIQLRKMMSKKQLAKEKLAAWLMLTLLRWTWFKCCPHSKGERQDRRCNCTLQFSPLATAKV